MKRGRWGNHLEKVLSIKRGSKTKVLNFILESWVTGRAISVPWLRAKYVVSVFAFWCEWLATTDQHGLCVRQRTTTIYRSIYIKITRLDWTVLDFRGDTSSCRIYTVLCQIPSRPNEPLTHKHVRKRCLFLGSCTASIYASTINIYSRILTTWETFACEGNPKQLSVTSTVNSWRHGFCDLLEFLFE